MRGLSPKLPLNPDSTDGFYGQITEHKDLVKQNLKNLLLTVPGERIMDLDFGVGLKSFLFSNQTVQMMGDIKSKIHEQVEIYMPFVSIVDVSMQQASSENADPNRLDMKVIYEVIPLDYVDELDISQGI